MRRNENERTDKTNNVRKIFHAASVQGQIGRGYIPIDSIERCIVNSLNEMNKFDHSSILFPLLGTGVLSAKIAVIIY